MLPTNLRITLIIAVICYFILILGFLKRKELALKYSLLWLFSGVLMGIFVIWPTLLLRLVRLLGIASAMNGLFIMCIAMILVILMALTSIVSKQTERIKNLTQTISRLEKRVRELEQDQSETEES